MSEFTLPSEVTDGYMRIIVGIDESDGSVLALQHAIGLAQKFGSTVEAVSVWRFPVSYTPLPATWSPDEDAKLALKHISDTVFGADWPSWYTATVRQGSPADVLIALGSSADLLIVGSRGLGGFTGLLLGSVSSQVVEHATCPVLVVRSPGEHTDDGH
ncbi:universal stress protein [Leifsonia sp. A12D58]|uniref:universal stress protein n=1 Tax=Leifsonia sp. A12D58 TaxID=3397674 RepID=UPI0039E05CA5